MISIIFGAGASFGSEKTGVKTPPLGNDLFLELNDLGGRFNELNNEIKNKFLKLGFESGMLEIPNDSRIVNPLQNELASYLSEFTPTGNSAYVRLFREISDIKKVSLITLNYDLLIELSLMFRFENIKVTFLKLHGSSNFVPNISFDFSGVTLVDCGSFIETDSVKKLKNHHEVKNWCDENNIGLSPVMCMYNKDKRMVICPSYLERAKKDYNELISKTNLLVIIGVKYIPHDKHVWDVILSNKMKIILVDPYPDENFVKLMYEKNSKSKLIKKSFYDSVSEISKFINLDIRKRG